MGLFGALVRTIVNTATLPVAAAQDITDSMTGNPTMHRTKEQLETLKREADEGEDE